MQNTTYNTLDVATTSFTNTKLPTYLPYTVVGKSDKLLQKKMKKFDFSDSTIDPEEIAGRLIETAKIYNTFGISANQCGLEHNVFVVGSGEEFVAFFNAQLIDVSDDEIVLPEANINDGNMMVYIKRPKDIFVEYIDFNGETKVKQYSGITARIIQQCLDRVNGIEFSMNVSKIKYERSKKAADKRNKKFARNIVRKVLVK